MKILVFKQYNVEQWKQNLITRNRLLIIKSIIYRKDIKLVAKVL